MIQSVPTLDRTALDHFYADLGAVHAKALWALDSPLMTPAPMPAMKPWRWSGSELRALCARARALVPMGAGGDRRVLTLANPGLGGLPFATPTVSCAYQTLGPHEVAPAHRHTPAALRFILEGHGVWTTVDGDLCEMHEGDLVLTPCWTFHDHRNSGNGTMTWFDGLDLPLVRSLDAIFYQGKPLAPEELVERENWSGSRYVAPGIVPDDSADTQVPWSRLLVFRRAGTDQALRALLDRSPSGVAVVQFTDPVTGRSALPTIGCRMVRLAPGASTDPVRRTGSSVFVVFRGAGRTVVDGLAIDWEEGDVVSLPSWCAIEHESAAGADLFAMSDDPVLRMLHLYRTEAVAKRQEVTAVFDG